jgi:hypothetical protein
MTRPWRLDHSTVLDNDGNPVAIIADPAGDGGGERIEWPWVYDEAPPASYAQAEDNARLIAASPDLLAALRQLMEWEGYDGGPPGNVHEFLLRGDTDRREQEVWQGAQAAIANATGQEEER